MSSYASRLNSSSSNRMSSFRSYLLKMAAISAASLSDRPYFSGLKPYVSFALLRVSNADRFLSVETSAFSFCNAAYSTLTTQKCIPSCPVQPCEYMLYDTPVSLVKSHAQCSALFRVLCIHGCKQPACTVRTPRLLVLHAACVRKASDHSMQHCP